MSALEQDLDEFMMGDEPDYDAEIEAPRDADEVDRRLRRLAKVRAEIAQVEEHAARQIDQVNAWAEARYDVLHGRARWLAEGLEMWHRAVLADDPSRKTISLPCGTLKSRAQQPVWEFDDVDAFLAWAREHRPELVRVKEEPNRAEAKRVLLVPDDLLPGVVASPYDDPSDEMVPGVTVTARPPSFTVTTEEVE